MTLTGPAVWTAFNDRPMLCQPAGLDRLSGPQAGPPPVEPKVVSLRGEYDRAAVDELAGLLVDAIAPDDADLVVDLRDVSFMDASTIGALVGIRTALGEHGRHLALRCPSRAARRVLGVCGLTGLVEVSSSGTQPLPSKAP